MKVKRGDIWYAELDGIGCEQKGIKPVAVIQNNVGNKNSPTIIGAVITSRHKNSYLPTHVKVWVRCPSVIMCEQLKTIDKVRLLEKIGTLSSKEIDKLDDALKISIGV